MRGQSVQWEQLLHFPHLIIGHVALTFPPQFTLHSSLKAPHRGYLILSFPPPWIIWDTLRQLGAVIVWFYFGVLKYESQQICTQSPTGKTNFSNSHPLLSLFSPFEYLLVRPRQGDDKCNEVTLWKFLSLIYLDNKIKILQHELLTILETVSESEKIRIRDKIQIYFFRKVEKTGKWLL